MLVCVGHTFLSQPQDQWDEILCAHRSFGGENTKGYWFTVVPWRKLHDPQSIRYRLHDAYIGSNNLDTPAHALTCQQAGCPVEDVAI